MYRRTNAHFTLVPPMSTPQDMRPLRGSFKRVGSICNVHQKSPVVGSEGYPSLHSMTCDAYQKESRAGLCRLARSRQGICSAHQKGFGVGPARSVTSPRYSDRTPKEPLPEPLASRCIGGALAGCDAAGRYVERASAGCGTTAPGLHAGCSSAGRWWDRGGPFSVSGKEKWFARLNGDRSLVALGIAGSMATGPRHPLWTDTRGPAA